MKFNFSLPFPIAVGTAFLLTACAGSRSTNEEEQASPVTAADSGIRYQLIYVVHGDANYEYHDSTGRIHIADTEAVAQAREVAQRAPHSEVFVFHQRARPWTWFTQPLDASMEQYRNGMRVSRTEYSREEGNDFENEARLFRRHSLPPVSKPLTRFFIYFGHEIPLKNGFNYSESWPEKNFSQSGFALGMGRFAPADSLIQPFALTVLSTCYGATPSMLRALSPLTHYVVASPAYLHLSFLDTRAFAELPADSVFRSDSTTRALADSLAEQSFQHLRANTQTEIAVGVYDMKKVSSFAHSFPENSKTSFDNFHDCALDSNFDSKTARAGVEMRYQPPRFGDLKDKLEHSGWECPGRER